MVCKSLVRPMCIGCYIDPNMYANSSIQSANQGIMNCVSLLLFVHYQCWHRDILIRLAILWDLSVPIIVETDAEAFP